MYKKRLVNAEELRVKVIFEIITQDLLHVWQSQHISYEIFREERCATTRIIVTIKELTSYGWVISKRVYHKAVPKMLQVFKNKCSKFLKKLLKSCPQNKNKLLRSCSKVAP